MLPVEWVVEDGEYPGEEVGIEVAEIVPDVLQDCKHYVEAEIEVFVGILEQIRMLSRFRFCHCLCIYLCVLWSYVLITHGKCLWDRSLNTLF